MVAPLTSGFIKTTTSETFALPLFQGGWRVEKPLLVKDDGFQTLTTKLKSLAEKRNVPLVLCHHPDFAHGELLVFSRKDVVKGEKLKALLAQYDDAMAQFQHFQQEATQEFQQRLTQGKTLLARYCFRHVPMTLVASEKQPDGRLKPLHLSPKQRLEAHGPAMVQASEKLLKASQRLADRETQRLQRHLVDYKLQHQLDLNDAYDLLKGERSCQRYEDVLDWTNHQSLNFSLGIQNPWQVRIPLFFYRGAKRALQPIKQWATWRPAKKQPSLPTPEKLLSTETAPVVPVVTPPQPVVSSAPGIVQPENTQPEIPVTERKE